MVRSKYWKKRFDDAPKADQINKGLPKRKISSKEQEKIDDFTEMVRQNGKKIYEREKRLKGDGNE